MRVSLTALAVLAALPGGVPVVAAQSAPAVTAVHQVRWIWKAEVRLDAPGHVVVVDWHPGLALVRRYPRRGAVTERLGTGAHRLTGDGRTPPLLLGPDGAAGGTHPSLMVWTGLGWASLSQPEINFSSTEIRLIARPDPAGRSVSRVRLWDGWTWHAFALRLPHAVSAAAVDSALADLELTGDPDVDIAQLAEMLGAAAWGGEEPDMRRRSGF